MFLFLYEYCINIGDPMIATFYISIGFPQSYYVIKQMLNTELNAEYKIKI